MTLAARSLNEQDATTTSWTRQQNRAVLIAGLACACFSVLATLITLRWFILMKRNFRHKLIMFLILGDTFKAFWYFVFPVVVFSRGPVESSSKFCQASGFFLSVGIEASDFAILMIALHAIVYIFHPPARSGDSGGIYRWRKWIYCAWIILPILAASLAFVNDREAYTTAGTFCYLPRRPFWYRLALSWIPRYFVMIVIFGMYTAVYIYVTLKFRSFSNLQDSGSQYSSASQSRRSSMSHEEIAPDEAVKPMPPVASPTISKFARPTFSRSGSHNREVERSIQDSNPWDEVSFITSTHLRKPAGWQPGVESSDFAFGSSPQHLPSINNARNFSQQDSTRLEVPPLESRKSSHAPTTNSQTSQMTGSTATPNPQEQHSRELATAIHKAATTPPTQHVKPKDPLKRTRKAIRKQLRYLFVYPLVYVLMWVFPFVSHCLLYDDYYVQNPIYWLTIVSTCMFSLQAGVDCVVFSWREKPWRRIPGDSKYAIDNIRSSFSKRHSTSSTNKGEAAGQSFSMAPQNEAAGGSLSVDDDPFRSGRSSRNTSNHWWEAEGRKRKDSVWMGTDLSDAAPTAADNNNNGDEDNSESSNSGAGTGIGNMGPGTLLDETIEEEERESPAQQMANGRPPEMIFTMASNEEPPPRPSMN